MSPKLYKTATATILDSIKAHVNICGLRNNAKHAYIIGIDDIMSMRSSEEPWAAAWEAVYTEQVFGTPIIIDRGISRLVIDGMSRKECTDACAAIIEDLDELMDDLMRMDVLNKRVNEVISMIGSCLLARNGISK